MGRWEGRKLSKVDEKKGPEIRVSFSIDATCGGMAGECLIYFVKNH